MSQPAFKHVGTTIEWRVQFRMARKWFTFGWPQPTCVEAEKLSISAHTQHKRKGVKFTYRIIRRTINDEAVE